MIKKAVIKKLLLVVTWLIIGSGMITLLVAANHKERAHVCSKILVTIKGDGQQMFFGKNDILQQLKSHAQSDLVGLPLTKMKLSQLERDLMKGEWIRDAQLYFDSRDALHVLIYERQPVARIFTVNGASFYIDSAGKRMPLLKDESARVLVVTNFPDHELQSKKQQLLDDVKSIARFVHNDPFWKEQLTQLDVRPGGKFEAVPLVGNHIIRIGDAKNIEEKFEKLFVFYKRVLKNTGFDKYSVIDVQYAQQVLGIKQNTTGVDSLQLQKNIEEILGRRRQQQISDSLLLHQNTIWADTALTPANNPDPSLLKPSNPYPAKTNEQKPDED